MSTTLAESGGDGDGDGDDGGGVVNGGVGDSCGKDRDGDSKGCDNRGGNGSNDINFTRKFPTMTP